MATVLPTQEGGMNKLRYSSNGQSPTRNKFGDLGIDLPSAGFHAIKPGDIKIIDTGIKFEFPLFGMVKRMLFRLLFGINVEGIGGLIRPRSRSQYDILGGVVDAGYRGKVKVKIYNCTNETVFINAGDRIAQMILTPVLGANLLETQVINEDTERGDAGGINL